MLWHSDWIPENESGIVILSGIPIRIPKKTVFDKWLDAWITSQIVVGVWISDLRWIIFDVSSEHFRVVKRWGYDRGWTDPPHLYRKYDKAIIRIPMNQPLWWNVNGGIWSLLRRACLTCPLGPWDFCAFKRVHQTLRLKNQYVRTPQALQENQETLVRQPTQRKNEIAEIIIFTEDTMDCELWPNTSYFLSGTHIDRHMYLPKVYGFLPKASALFKPWGLRPGWWCLFFSNLTYQLI